MAGRLIFHFTPGDSALHRWDARCKFAGLLVISIGLLYMDVPGLSLFSAAFAVSLPLSRLPWKEFFKDLRLWGLFLLFIFCLQAVSLSGREPSVLPWLTVTKPGLVLAFLSCWRLALILCYATLFTAVTRPHDLQDALVWIMKPFPFLPARRIALMVSLTLRFLPLIMDHGEEVRLAGRSRLAHQRRNLLERIKYFALPLFRKSLLRADQMALALAARGYDEDLPARMGGIPARHLFGLAFLAALVVFLAGPVPDILAKELLNFMEEVRRTAA